MKLTPETSSEAVKAHSYNPETRKLRMQFHGSSTTYEYSDVPPEKYAAMTGAASMGAFHNKKIRPFHEARKVR